MSNISLNLTRVIKASREVVFKAWTDPEMIMQWWHPGTNTCAEASVDLRVGGAIRIGNQPKEGDIIWMNGIFEEVTPPSRLIYSWIMGINMTDPTRVTIEFNDHPEGTELVLTHVRFASEQARDAHIKGWGACLDGLDEFLIS